VIVAECMARGWFARNRAAISAIYCAAPDCEIMRARESMTLATRAGKRAASLAILDFMTFLRALDANV